MEKVTSGEVIEELTHAMQLLTEIVCKDWNVMGDGWNTLAVVSSYHNKSVDVFKSQSNSHEVIGVTLWDKSNCHLHIELDVKENLVALVIIPMIESYLMGDRSEVKAALSPLVEISPAIN
jgi:hypothetical protein